MARGREGGAWLMALAAAIGLIVSLIAYFHLGSGIDHTAGALLVIISTVLLTGAGVVLALTTGASGAWRTVLNVLCPWCMVTWTVTIPTFWAVTLYNLKEGNIPVPERARRLFGTLYSWVPLITIVSYAIVAVLAQIQLDWIHRAFV